MKVANLVIAIIGTTLIAITVLYNSGDVEIFIGALMFAPPVVLNWMSWSYLKKLENRGR